METVTAKRLLIHGRVQGVGYRESMRQEASRLGLSGWVRNRHDGTVEALVGGSAVAVESLIAWARRGPRFAQVEKVDIADAPASAGKGFSIVFE
jgi:acylphosphatase